MSSRYQRVIASFFIVYLVCIGIQDGFYLALYREPPPILQLGQALGLVWSALAWIRVDARTRQISFPFDSGLLFFAFWLVPGLWYLYQRRGFRCLALILLLYVGYAASVCLGWYIAIQWAAASMY